MKRLAFLVVVAACGGDDSGGGGGGAGSTVSGTIGGRTITVADAISSNTDYTVGSTVLHYGTVVMGEAPAICDLAATGTPPTDEIIVGIVATTLDTSGGTNVSKLPTVGTYTVNAGQGNLAFATVHVDGNCATFEIKATTGTVTLTSASPSNGRYAGTFDLILESGDHIMGTFDPTVCTALTAPELTCM